MDFMHDMTEKELQELERRINKIYYKASVELKQKAENYMNDFIKEDDKKRNLLKEEKITELEYKQWRTNKIAYGKRFDDLRKQYAKDITKANALAQQEVNETLQGIFINNANYMGYVLDTNTSVSFAVYDKTTIGLLIKNQPNLLPLKVFDDVKSIRWNAEQFSKQIALGILQGESIPDIAKRLYKKFPEMNMNSALTNARTGVTSAQNAGRTYRNEEARNKYGIKVEDVWKSAIDGRTRSSHRHANGQARGKDGYFDVGGSKLEYPGDPKGEAIEVYNCRCTIVPKLKGYDGVYQSASRKKMESKEYNAWVNRKTVKKNGG